MEYVHLGRTGLKVSRLCLGTMNFGPWTPEDESHRIMDRALDLGFNFFDTANVYGQHIGKGATESIVGRWLAKGDGRREKIVLATKVYGAMGEGPNDGKLSAYGIRRACEDSLRRLQTDHIDLYQMHHIDRQTPWEEIWQAMEQLVREGKVIYVGSSNFAAWNIVQANAIAAGRHFLGLVSEQSIYNLRNRHIELEVLPACRALGLGVIPWSPMGGGLLCGVLEGAKEGRRTREPLQKSVVELRPQLEAYESLCREIGQAPADVALAWVMTNPAVTTPIIGPRSIKQLEDSARVPDIALSPETLAKLNEIWPGPGNQAPEAYAW
jgi:aryl-alcohol dehydrogenase-like predicted oxidoreductase